MWTNKAGCISGRRRTDFQKIAFFTFAALPCLAANKVTDVRFWSAGEITRVAIEVTGEFRYRADRLSGPDRVFFDITNAVPSTKSRTIRVGDGRVKQIRLAETEPGVTRVVLDVEEGMEFTASQLTNPERLMVELRPKSTGTVSSAAPPQTPAKVEVAAVNAAPTVTPNPAPVKPAPPKLEVAAPKPVTATQVAAVVPQPASRNSNGDRSLTRVLGLKIGKVVIDPGHGGHDQGTKGKSGLLEKDLTLDVAKRLAVMLRERLGTEVVLTREDDSYPSLEERTEMANASKADLFLSIHANWNPARSVAGIDTYYRYFSANREDLDLATRENAGTTRSVFDLQETVMNIAARAKVDESRELALLLQKSLHAAAAKENSEARSRPVKRAPFVVLIGANMPSVLVEIGFLSNVKEEKLLNSGVHRDRLAEALYDGIDAYFNSLSHTDIARAVE